MATPFVLVVLYIYQCRPSSVPPLTLRLICLMTMSAVHGLTPPVVSIDPIQVGGRVQMPRA